MSTPSNFNDYAKTPLNNINFNNSKFLTKVDKNKMVNIKRVESREKHHKSVLDSIEKGTGSIHN